MCVCAYRVRDEKAHLARAAFAGGGEANDVGSGRGSAPKDVQHRAATAGGDERKLRVTCVGRSVCGERVHGRRAAALTSALRRRCRSLNACGDVW